MLVEVAMIGLPEWSASAVLMMANRLAWLSYMSRCWLLAKSRTSDAEDEAEADEKGPDDDDGGAPLEEKGIYKSTVSNRTPRDRNAASLAALTMLLHQPRPLVFSVFP